MNVPYLEIVGIFPSLDSSSVGGVQVSGREAWRGIVAHIGTLRSHAVQYESGTSKAKAVLQTMRNRKRTARVIVWHLQLVKLLPLLEHAGSRVILFLHGVEAWLRHDSVTRFLLRNVDLFLSNSDHTWCRFLECNPAFHGVSHRTVHLGLGSSLGVPTPAPVDPPAVLMIGRLDKREDYKGHRQIIEAWSLVLEHRPDAQLWIAGDGDLRPALEDLAQRNTPRHSVRFFGEVSEEEKEALLARCRCLALPSRREGFGLVYLEAMRMGRPCLVSNLDAGQEVVNPPEAGLAVDPDDPAEIARALDRLLAPGDEWQHWSTRARRRYESRFTSEQFHQRLLTAVFES
jgi:phosphatidylinositol alpha-1,6-mannosyltransferase